MAHVPGQRTYPEDTQSSLALLCRSWKPALASDTIDSLESTNTMASKAKDDGNRLFKEGRFADAQRRYSQGIAAAGPRIDKLLLAQLYSNRSATHFKLKQLAEATKDAQEAAKLAPQWAKPHLRLAESLHAEHKYAKAVAELEIALGIASASQDEALVDEIHDRLPEYRLLKDSEERGESLNQAYDSTFMNKGAFREAAQAMNGLGSDQDPGALLDKLLRLDLSGSSSSVFDRSVILGHQALLDGRYTDAAREFLAAATSGNAEGMYNYAVLVESGKGVPQNIKEAVRWLEKAASMPVDETEGGHPGEKNRGIGEAMSSLARHHQLGIHYPKNETKAAELWKRAAKIGSVAALNALGVMHAFQPAAGVPEDLPKARDYLRQSAEKFSNEAMLNLAELHASLQEYETAARWADSAHRFGFLPASQAANKYRELGKLVKQAQGLDPVVRRGMEEMGSIVKMPGPSLERANATPTIEELRAIKTPYGERLRLAKELIADASAYADENETEMAVAFAVQAHQIIDSALVFSKDETRMSVGLARMTLDYGVPLDAGLALMLQPSDQAATIAFWCSLHRKFPSDLRLAVRAACAMMFKALAGSDQEGAVKLFDEAFKLLPNPSDDSDPETMHLLYLAGSSHWQLQHMEKAKGMLSRFLVHAVHDGHRKVHEAHFLLGLIEVMDVTKGSKKNQAKTIRAAADHLCRGVALGKALPPFLKREASGNQRMLSTMLQMWSSAKNVPLNIPDMDEDASQVSPRQAHTAAPTSIRRGGELLPTGPRRHEKLRSDCPPHTQYLKTDRVSMMKMMGKQPKGHTRLAWSMAPPKTSTGRRATRVPSPATIDELFSSLEDRVYTGRSLTCVVIATPFFTGSSHAMIVEDSQREAAKLSVYNASKVLVEALVPGQVLYIEDPYVRLAQDSSFMLRVDDPANKLRLGELHALCWACSVGSDAASLQCCAKCRRARYCSRACQKQDWSEHGHRHLCG